MKEKFFQALSWLGDWCKENIDFAFILAVFTETPRWTVTFMAIHEPLWIGIPLGVLLAFATTKVWKHYFITRNRTLLGFNVAAIVLAMMVITPVLYAMMEKPPDQVDVTAVLVDLKSINPLRAVWAAGLALLTFAPLVQLASVHGSQTQSAIVQDAKPVIVHTPSVTVQSDDAQPEPEIMHDAQPDIAERVSALRAEGFEDQWIAVHELGHIPQPQLARALGVSASTISRWRKAAQKNGHSKEMHNA